MKNNKESKTLKKELRNLITKGKIEVAIILLEEYLEATGKSTNLGIISLSYLKSINKNKLNHTITSEEYNISKNRIISSLLDWINSNIADDVLFSQKPEDHINISIPDLKTRISAILEHNGLIPVFGLLRKLISKSEKNLEVSIIEEEYFDKTWELNNGHFEIDEWEILQLDHYGKIKKIIHNIHEDDLNFRWKSQFFHISMGIDRNDITPVFALFSRADLIKVPSQIYIQREKQRYKRLMYLYQDSYASGEYEKAYDYCQQIRIEIETESAQLYEYLMLSYFKLKGEQEIIKKALHNNDDSDLRKVFVYANRFKDLQDKKHVYSKNLTANKNYIEEEIPSSKTGYSNKKQITSGLMLALKNEYSKIDFDYISNASDILISDKLMIQRCLQIATWIAQYMQSDIVFAEIIVNEIAGGNKYKWLTIDKSGEIANYVKDYNALLILKNIKKLIRYYESKKDNNDSVDQILSDNLASSLKEKYNKIKEDYSNNEIELIIFKKNIIKCIEAHRVGCLLFEGENWKKFCDWPIKELSGENGLIDWFQLTREPDLTYNRVFLDIGSSFDPKENLQYFVLKRDGPVEWEKLKEKLMDLAYQKLVMDTATKYDRVSKFGYLPADDNLHCIKEIIDCFENWLTCYALYKEEKFIHLCLNELTGSGKYFWFQPDEKYGLTTNDELSELDFDAGEYLNGLLDRLQKGYRPYYGRIAENYFKKIIVPGYNKVIRGLDKYARGSAERSEAFEWIRQVFTLFKQVNANPEFYQFLEGELLNEINLVWLDVREDGLVNHSRLGDTIKDNIGELLLETITLFPYPDKPTQEVVLRKVIESRYKDCKKEYDRDFNRIRKRNHLLEDRLQMVQLYERIKVYFEKTGDPSYLEIPYREFVLHRGRIRWGRLISFGWLSKRLDKKIWLWEHWQNKEIADFSFHPERRFVADHFRNDKKMKSLSLLK